MPFKTEGQWQAEFIVSEANGTRSRDKGTLTVPAGQKVIAGQVLGQLTATGQFCIHNPAGADGSETVKALLISPMADNTAGGGAAIFNVAVLTRDAEVNQAELIFIKTGNVAMTQPDIDAALVDLAAAHVVCRPAV